MKADMLITNGRVIDPARAMDAVGDVAVVDGRIAAIPAGEVVDAAFTLNAAGCLVLPGLIDAHAHVFFDGTDIGVSPDSAMLPMGVTSTVDPGSAGVSNLPVFFRTVAGQRVRVKAMLNMCPTGLGTTQYHETVRPETWDKKKILLTYEKYRDRLLGLKIRLSRNLVGDTAERVLADTLALAEQLRCPVTIHMTDPALPCADVAKRLRPGDIFCHVYHGTGDTIMCNGKVHPKVREAQERGVIFDCSNGMFHFSFATAEAALADGFLPDIISTDLTTRNLYKPLVVSLPYLMSKYLALGMELADIAAAVTSAPARFMGLEGEIGCLAPGACADISIFRLEKKNVTFKDTQGQERRGDTVFMPLATVREGRLLYRNMAFLDS